MKLDSVLKWFMPKEERFHVLFERDTEVLQRAARLFVEIARSDSLEERRVKVVELKAIEHEGDDVTRQVFEALNSTFITPLDREDIRSLASNLDDILDYLEGVAQALVLFEMSEAPEGLRQFAGIIMGMVEEIGRLTALLWDLSREKEIRDRVVRISELENQGDALYNTVIADLFRGDGRSPVEILKWKEIYDGLEAACDECKNFTHTLANVVIKNA
jgi:predicted phosphate transport protein (TIGR00153 family)